MCLVPGINPKPLPAAHGDREEVVEEPNVTPFRRPAALASDSLVNLALRRAHG
jgi:hypothetical protein